MEYNDEVKKRRERLRDAERKINPEERDREQDRLRQEVGEEIIQKIKKIIYERYPELDGVEPIIRDETLEKLAGNILNRLKQLKTTDKEVDELKKAWKSLLFVKDITKDEAELVRRIIAIINKRGDLLRIDESVG